MVLLALVYNSCGSDSVRDTPFSCTRSDALRSPALSQLGVFEQVEEHDTWEFELEPLELGDRERHARREHLAKFAPLGLVVVHEHHAKKESASRIYGTRVYHTNVRYREGDNATRSV